MDEDLPQNITFHVLWIIIIWEHTVTSEITRACQQIFRIYREKIPWLNLMNKETS